MDRSKRSARRPTRGKPIPHPTPLLFNTGSPIVRSANVVNNEFRSRRRRQGAFDNLKRRVEELPDFILQALLSRVEQPPTTRQYLLQAQIYGVAACIIE